MIQRQFGIFIKQNFGQYQKYTNFKLYITEYPTQGEPNEVQRAQIFYLKVFLNRNYNSFE